MSTTLQLTSNAVKVLEKRYLRKDQQGKVCELPEDMIERVAKFIAGAGQLYDMGQTVEATASVFADMIASLDFLPNSPTLMNAGTAPGPTLGLLCAAGR